MILCDHRIEKAVRDGRIIIDPPLDSSRLESTALNLRVGDDFLVWKQDLSPKGVKSLIDLDNIDLAEISGLTNPLKPNAAKPQPNTNHENTKAERTKTSTTNFLSFFRFSCFRDSH
jgi:hypothetical protein